MRGTVQLLHVALTRVCLGKRAQPAESMFDYSTAAASLDSVMRPAAHGRGGCFRILHTSQALPDTFAAFRIQPG
jgi:hypothetical protein